MKRLIIPGLILAPLSIATAHQLPGDESLLMQAAHQLLSPHHLPLLVLVLLAGVALIRISRSGKE
jgi:hypothetical protein